MLSKFLFTKYTEVKNHTLINFFKSTYVHCGNGAKHLASHPRSEQENISPKGPANLCVC